MPQRILSPATRPNNKGFRRPDRHFEPSPDAPGQQFPPPSRRGHITVEDCGYRAITLVVQGDMTRARPHRLALTTADALSLGMLLAEAAEEVGARYPWDSERAKAQGEVPS